MTKRKPILADICRWSARITAVLAMIFVLFYLLFAIGYSLSSPDLGVILAYTLPLLGILMGLFLAYWKEQTGAFVGFISFLLLFIMIGIFVSVEDMVDDFSTFVILLIPIGLFFFSWLFRN